MAEMFPEEVSQFKTQGEAIVYRFLSAAARPDSQFTAWYTPHVEEREPDFVLYGSDIGLLVIEVKDWAAGQIVRADPERFQLRMGRADEQRSNPLRQAEQYSLAIRNRMAREELLRHREGPHLGKPKIPVAEAVAFPRMSREEFAELGLGEVIPESKAFLLDDFGTIGIGKDRSGHRFRHALQERFPPLFPFRLDSRELDRLRRVLFPQIEMRTPERDGRTQYEDRREQLLALDRTQQQIAKKIGGGHRIFTGPSGSGKTLVLVHRAALLQRYDARIRRILFLCYNVSLAHYLRDLLSRNRVPMGEGGVQVKPFFELCEEIIGEKIAHERESDEYYDLIAEEALGRIEAGSVPLYQAILVDEGQDFSTPMLRVVRGLLDASTNNLLIALDQGQDIYRRRKSWKEAGIDARGRVKPMRDVYRSSRPLVEFAGALLEEVPQAGGGRPDPLSHPRLPLPAPASMRGPAPELEQMRDPEAAVDRAAGWIQELAEEGPPLAEFAVLYARTRSAGDPTLHYPQAIQRSLLARGLECVWASENYTAKRVFRLGAEAVTISTVHSAKGLDWECVVLLGLDELPSSSDADAAGARLLAYVGVGRARRRLLIPYTRRTSMIERLERALEGVRAA